MKRILKPLALAALALLALTLTALAQSGGTLKSVNDTNELVMLNPRSGNTNVLVHAMPWLSSSFWTWHEGDATPADTNHLDSVLYPGLGRWVWNNIGTNYFQTLVVSNFVGAGDSLWTNLGGILQPQNLTLPVMITNQLQFGPGTTNVLYRSGTDLVYTNGATTAVRFKVIDGGGNEGRFGVDSGGNATVIAGFGKDVKLGPDLGGELYFAHSTGFYPQTTNLMLGLQSGMWGNQYFAGHNYHYGFYEAPGLNYSRLDVYQSGTNSPLVLDQVTAGTAGYSRGFSFRTNGVEVFNVTGTGGPSSAANWVASGTTDSTLAGTATTGALSTPLVTNTPAGEGTFRLLSPTAFDADNRPYRENIKLFPNTGGSRSNLVWNWGYNASASGGALDLTDVGFYEQMESYYNAAGNPAMEWHLNFWGTNNAWTLRPFGIYVDTTNRTLIEYKYDVINFINSTSLVQNFAINDVNFYAASPNATYKKARNNEATYMQLNAAGLSYKYGPYLDALDTWIIAAQGETTAIKGDVGIKTNAPSEALEVAGNIKASGSVNAASYQINGINGWTGFWTNMIPGVITQRICISGGATTNVITL